MKINRRTRRDARRLFRLCLQNGRLHAARVREVTQKIIERKYRGYIELLWQFHRLVKMECDQHKAEIASVVPLPDELRVRIIAELEHRYGVGIATRFVERPELIGGIRLVVGSDVYDDSVRYRLAQLEETLSASSRG